MKYEDMWGVFFAVLFTSLAAGLVAYDMTLQHLVTMARIAHDCPTK